MTDAFFADNLSEAFDHLPDVLVVRVPRSPLVARLRPSSDFDTMNLFPTHVLRSDDVAQPDYKDPCGIRIREHRRISRIPFIELRQKIQVRLIIGRDVVSAKGLVSWIASKNSPAPQHANRATPCAAGSMLSVAKETIFAASRSKL